MSATLNLEIPTDVLESARMTIRDAKLELAIALFANGRLSQGKAAELADVSTGEFQMHLGSRHLGPHYTTEDALDDKAVLSSARAS